MSASNAYGVPETTWSGKAAGVPRFITARAVQRGRRIWWVLDTATGDAQVYYRTWEEAHERAELLNREVRS